MKLNKLLIFITIIASLTFIPEGKSDDLPEILPTGTPFDVFNNTEYDLVLIQYANDSKPNSYLQAKKIALIENTRSFKLMGINRCSDYLSDEILSKYDDNWDLIYINGDRYFLDSKYFERGLLIFKPKKQSQSTINRYVCLPHITIKKFTKNNTISSESFRKFFNYFKQYKINKTISIESLRSNSILSKVKVFPIENLDLNKSE